MKTISIVAAVLLASCADGRRAPPVAEATKASAPAPVATGPAAAPAATTSSVPAPAHPDAVTVQPSPPGGDGVPGTSLADKVGGGGVAGVPPVQRGTLVRDQAPAAPSTLGQVGFASAGCATVASAEEGARFPARAPTRSGAPTVSVTPVRGGASVKHEVTHACCLKAAAVSRVERRVVILTERLSGVPCRCLCGSTLTSSVALVPGDWKVAVDLDTNGSVERVGTFDVAVK